MSTDRHNQFPQSCSPDMALNVSPAAKDERKLSRDLPGPMSCEVKVEQPGPSDESDSPWSSEGEDTSCHGNQRENQPAGATSSSIFRLHREKRHGDKTRRLISFSQPPFSRSKRVSVRANGKRSGKRHGVGMDLKHVVKEARHLGNELPLRKHSMTKTVRSVSGSDLSWSNNGSFVKSPLQDVSVGARSSSEYSTSSDDDVHSVTTLMRQTYDKPQSRFNRCWPGLGCSVKDQESRGLESPCVSDEAGDGPCHQDYASATFENHKIHPLLISKTDNRAQGNLSCSGEAPAAFANVHAFIQGMESHHESQCNFPCARRDANTNKTFSGRHYRIIKVLPEEKAGVECSGCDRACDPICTASETIRKGQVTFSGGESRGGGGGYFNIEADGGKSEDETGVGKEYTRDFKSQLRSLMDYQALLSENFRHLSAQLDGIVSQLAAHCIQNSCVLKEQSTEEAKALVTGAKTIQSQEVPTAPAGMSCFEIKHRTIVCQMSDYKHNNSRKDKSPRNTTQPVDGLCGTSNNVPHISLRCGKGHQTEMQSSSTSTTTSCCTITGNDLDCPDRSKNKSPEIEVTRGEYVSLNAAEARKNKEHHGMADPRSGSSPDKLPRDRQRRLNSRSNQLDARVARLWEELHCDVHCSKSEDLASTSVRLSNLIEEMDLWKSKLASPASGVRLKSNFSRDGLRKVMGIARTPAKSLETHESSIAFRPWPKSKSGDMNWSSSVTGESLNNCRCKYHRGVGSNSETSHSGGEGQATKDSGDGMDHKNQGSVKTSTVFKRGDFGVTPVHFILLFTTVLLQSIVQMAINYYNT